MKTFTCFALAACLAPFGTALNLVKKSSPSVIHTHIHRKNVTNHARRDQARKDYRLRKRANVVSETLDNELTLYYANVSLGTPAQNLYLHIDTGSSDLWVNAPNSTLCEEYKSECDTSGVYTASDSSTYAYVNSDFNITYEDGSGAVGIYATDNLELGDITLENIQFGIGYTSTSAEGILGIGYALNEAEITYGKTYANVPKALVNQGYINTNAYSLWLNDLDSSTGSILFGGVNTDKYTGSLATIPIIQEYGAYYEFLVALTAVGQNGDNTSLASNQAIAVLLDSGTSLTYLPDSIADTIISKYSATYESSVGAAIIDCDYADSTDTVDYTFSGQTISIAMRELVLVGGEENGEEYCIFGIAPSGASSGILGDTFLRSAYVVFDLSNNEISIAQTVYNSTTDNILEITSGSDGVPDAVAVASAVTSISTEATAGARIDSPGTTTSVNGAAGRAMATPPPRVMNAAAAVVAGVGIMMVF